MSFSGRRLVLLRHGRTEWNRVRRAQGQAMVPLDEHGHAQARAVAPLLAALRPVRLWSSDLTRAVQTAAPVAQACGLEVRYDPRLREFSVGEREGMTWDEASRRYPHAVEGRSLGEMLRGVPGAESDQDVWDRIVPAVTECLGSLGPGETGVVVSHGAAIKLALVGLLGCELEAARAFAVLDNCRWATVEAGAEATPGRLRAYGAGDFASEPAIGYDPQVARG